MSIKAFFVACLMAISTCAMAQHWTDVTSQYIQNPDFKNNTNAGWTFTADAQSKAVSYGCMEFFNGTWDIWQEVTLPAGKYRLSVQAFYRAGVNSNDNVEKYKNGTENITCYLYAGGKQQKLKSVYSYPLAEKYSGSWQNLTQDWLWEIGDKMYYPNSMEGGQYCFQRGGYWNEMVIESTGEPMRIGLKNATKTNSNWTLFDNWKIESELKEVAPLTAEALIVNEIMVANVDMYVSPNWNYSSWIELYNPTDNPVFLDNAYFSDDAANLKKFRMPQTAAMIPAHGYCTVWFDEHDERPADIVNLKLDCDGGTIYISDADGNLLVQQDYPTAVSRASYARKTDGGNEWAYTAMPTMGATNAESRFTNGQLAAPKPDKVGQLFSSSISVTVPLGSVEGLTLRYTTDGTTPTLTNGKTSADGKFSFTATTNLRLRFFKDGYLPSPVTTHSYIKKDKAYYLPVISITTNRNNLYSNELGVFVKGTNGRRGNGQDTPCNWNMDWDRPVNFEYFVNGQSVLSQEVNLARCGGWSRAWEPFSYKLKANKVYEGQNFLPYEFFPEKPYLKHKTLQIRNGGNDNNARFKDGALQEIIRTSGIYVEGQAYKPVHQFINGEYKGLINMREPNNKHHAYAHYGYDSELIDQFEISPDSGYVQMEGTREVIDLLVELSKNAADPDVYEQIKQYIDIDEAINYLAIEIWLGGDDWPKNNVKAYRLHDGGKFHFVLFDLDFAFNKTSNAFTWFESTKTFTGNVIYDTGKAITWTNPIVQIFLGLMKNADFCRQFTDAYCLVGGSVFETSRSNSIIEQLRKTAYTAMTWESVWGGNLGSTLNDKANEIKNNLSGRNSNMVNALKNYSNPSKNAFALNDKTRQTVKLSSELATGLISVNGLQVPTNSFNGFLFAPIKVSATVPHGYRFVGWRNASGNIVSADTEYALPSSGNITLTAAYEPLPAVTQIVPVRINEVSASNDVYVNEYFKKNDWIELYNPTNEAVDIAGAYLTDNENKPQKYQIPTNRSVPTLIPAHGYRIIWCDKLDNLNDIHASFKLSNTTGEYVLLTAADGSWSDKLVYPAHNGNQSVGRYPDGADNVYLMDIPTIKSANILTSNASFVNKQAEPGYDAIHQIQDTTNTTQSPAYNLQGQSVNHNYKGIVITKGKKLLRK